MSKGTFKQMQAQSRRNYGSHPGAWAWANSDECGVDGKMYIRLLIDECHAKQEYIDELERLILVADLSQSAPSPRDAQGDAWAKKHITQAARKARERISDERTKSE